MSVKTKTSSWQLLKHEVNGEPYFERVTETKEFDTIDGWKTDKSKTVVEKLTPDAIGLFKRKEILVAFKREAVSTHTLLPLQAWFTQKLVVSVDKSKEFKHVWLNLTNGKLFIQFLGWNGNYTGLTCQASFTKEEACLTIRKSRPKRIDEMKLAQMAKDGQVMVFDDETLTARTIAFYSDPKISK